MDKATAISLLLTIAKERSNVDIFQDLNGINPDAINAVNLSSPNLGLWQIKFGKSSVQLMSGCMQLMPDNVTCLGYESLVTHYSICPSFTPKPYGSCKQAFAYEDVTNYAVLWSELHASRVDMVAIKKLGSNLGELHNLSHTASNSMVVRDIVKKFGNDNLTANEAMVSLFVDTISEQTASALADGPLKEELLKVLKNGELSGRIEALRVKLTHRKECLSHAKLSTESIGIHNGDVKLCSGHSTTFLGPCSYDLSTLLADYIYFYHEHMLTEVDNDRHRQVAYKMVEACQATVDGYLSHMTMSMGNRDEYVSSLMSDAAGYCGVHLIARAIQLGRSAAGSAEVRGKAVATIQSGIRLLTAAPRIHDVGHLVNIALMLTL